MAQNYNYSGRMGQYLNGGQLALGAGQGALSGASTGAAIGSIIPGIGTAIGGGIGALVGGISGFFKNKKAQEANEASLAQQEEDTEKLVAANNLANDTAALQAFPSKGVKTAPFGLKDGGPAPKHFKAIHGGSMKRLAPGVFLAKGNPHSKGGIKGDTDHDGMVDVEIEGDELFFDNVGESGFVINKDISRKFTPQLRKIKGNSKLDKNTRNLLIGRAIEENENRRAKLGALI